MALKQATKEHLAKVADSAATFQLAAEEAARRLTFPPIERATDRLVVTVATNLESKDAALKAAYRATREVRDQLEAEFAAAMREARAIAREFAMRQVAVEAEPLIATARHALVLTPSLSVPEVEALWAEHAAAGVARRFGAAALSETQAWKNSRMGEAALPRLLGRVGKRLEAEQKLHSVTQSVGVFNEAKREKWLALKEGRPGTLPLPAATPFGLPKVAGGKGGGRGDGLGSAHEIWSAVLDRKTCPVCWRLDGTMVKLGKPFPEGATTPLHGHCRCCVVTAFIADEHERYLAGASDDYESLKADIKDYMGSHRFDVGEGVRHAKRFVDEMFAERYPSQPNSPIAGSALVLTRRMNDQSSYFPNIVRPRAPSLRW